MFKVNNKYHKSRRRICSKITTETSERPEHCKMSLSKSFFAGNKVIIKISLLFYLICLEYSLKNIEGRV